MADLLSLIKKYTILRKITAVNPVENIYIFKELINKY